MRKYSAFGLLRNAFSHNRKWREAWRSPDPKKQYDAIIVGGGGHGLATAYYLAKEHGVRNIAVLEKGWIGGGNTGRNTTIVRSNYLWTEASLLYEHSLKLWEGLSQDINYNVMFSQRGVYNLGHTLQDMRDIERRVNANRLNGIDAEIVSAAQIAKAIPHINTSPDARYPILGASLQRRAGVARHDAVAWGFARAADARGVDIIEQCEASLRRLQTDYIDIFFLHRTDWNIPQEETLSALDYLVNQGKASSSKSQVLRWEEGGWEKAGMAEIAVKNTSGVGCICKCRS